MKFALDWNYNIPTCNTSFKKSYTETFQEFTELECMELQKLLESNTQHKVVRLCLWVQDVETQIQTKLNQPTWKNGQHQTPETRPQLQTSRKKRLWTPQETMAIRRCQNRSNDLTHGERWWWWWRWHAIHQVKSVKYLKGMRFLK